MHRRGFVGHVSQLLVLGGDDLASVLDRRNLLRVGSRNLEPAQDSRKAGGRPVGCALQPKGLKVGNRRISILEGRGFESQRSTKLYLYHLRFGALLAFHSLFEDFFPYPTGLGRCTCLLTPAIFPLSLPESLSYLLTFMVCETVDLFLLPSSTLTDSFAGLSRKVNGYWKGRLVGGLP